MQYWEEFLTGWGGLILGILSFIFIFIRVDKINDYMRKEKLKKELETSKKDLIKNMDIDIDLIIKDDIYDKKMILTMYKDILVFEKYIHLFSKKSKKSINDIKKFVNNINTELPIKEEFVGRLLVIHTELKSIKDTGWGGNKNAK